MQSYRLPFWSRWRQGNGGPPASIANGSGHMFPESNGTSRESGTPLFASLADFEEIYLGALVPDAKRGYSILKIAEMLQSGFIRSLSADVKRNSVLMALEAAGFSLEEVLQDAGARQRALCAYESMQQKRLDEVAAQEAQKAVEVQAELEHINAEYAARLKTSRDEVARLQERFKAWQASKTAETQRLTDAVAQCVAQGRNMEVVTSVMERVSVSDDRRRPQMAPQLAPQMALSANSE